MTGDPEFVEVMWLIRNGVAEEKAWSLSKVERLARAITFMAFEGVDWDWDRMQPKERPSS